MEIIKVKYMNGETECFEGVVVNRKPNDTYTYIHLYKDGRDLRKLVTIPDNAIMSIEIENKPLMSFRTL